MLFARALGLFPLIFVALCASSAAEVYGAEAVALRWSAPADCPTGADVLGEVNRLLGPRASLNEASLEVVAEVQRKDDGTYLVRLEIPGEDGLRSREVSAVSCAALGQAAALILAMMVDPEAALAAEPAPGPGQTLPEQSPPGQTPPQPSEPKQILEAPRPSQPIPSAPPPSPVRSIPSSPVPAPKPGYRFIRPPMAPSIFLLGDIGTLPSPSFGIGGAVVVFPGRLRVESGISYLIPRRATFASLVGAWTDVDLALWYASAGVVLRVHSRFEFTPKLRFEAGRLHAESFGVTDPDEGSAPLVGMGIGGQGALRLWRQLNLVVGLDRVYYVAYPKFVVTGLGDVHTPSRSVVRFTLGAEWRF